MLEKDLEQIGLDEKEAKVYLAALELGSSTVQKIAKQAGVNRATCYFIIEALTKLGLMSSFYKGKKQFFVSADPDQLDELLEKQKSEIEDKKKALEKIMPQLEAFTAKRGRPVVKLYEGKDGILTMVEEFSKLAKGSVNMAYSVDAVNNLFTQEERLKARTKRIKRNIKTKVIYTFKEGELSSDKYGQRRIVPFEKYPISFDLAVFSDRIRIASLKRLVGIIIEDKEIATSLKAVLDLAWEAAEKYQKK